MYVCLLHFCVPWFVSKAWVMFPPGETIWFIKFESSKDPRWTPESSKDPRSTPESSKDPRSTPSKTSSNLSYCDCQSWNCSFCQSCSSCPTRSIGAPSVFAFLRSQQKRSFYLDQLLFYKKMTRITYPSKKRKLYAKIMESAVLDTTQDLKKKRCCEILTWNTWVTCSQSPRNGRGHGHLLHRLGVKDLQESCHS